MKSEFTGNIVNIRAVEDAIRASKQYTEGLSTMWKHHPDPIRGDGYSRAFHKCYEVYPGVEIDWNMPANVAIDWLWGDTPRVDVEFRYDYRVNKASVVVKNGSIAVKELAKTILGFSDALAIAIAGPNGKASKASGV